MVKGKLSDPCSPHKVLMITARADYGGGPEHIYRIAESLSASFQPYIACPEDKPYYQKYAALIGEDRIFTISHRKFSWSLFLRLRRWVKQNSLCLIHAHGKGAGLYGRLLSLFTGIPCVYTFHGVHLGQYSPLSKLFYRIYERLSACFTKTIVAVSLGEAKKIALARLAPKSKVALIPNGVRIPEMKVSSELLSKAVLNIINVTRFDYAKNPMLLLKILDELRQQKSENHFRLHIIGDGDDRAEFQAAAKREGLSDLIEFHGFQDNLEPYFLSSFCCLSTSRWEGLPLSVLEAMSYGVPVIATDVIGNADLVLHKETGFLYQIEEPAAAAKQLLQLSTDPSLWKLFSEKGRTRVKEYFSIERQVTEIENVYFEVLKK